MIPDINLLPERERRTSSSQIVWMLMGLIFVLLLAFIIFQYVSLTKNINSLEAEQEVLEEERIALESKVDSLESVEEVDLDTAVAFIENVSYPVSPLLIEVNKYITPHAYLRDYHFTETEIRFSVDFETMTDIVQYVGDLQGSVYFNDVKVEEITRFDPVQHDEEQTNGFDNVERFTNQITVTIDPSYILSGGDLR